VVVPQLESLKKEGEAGRRKITQYTRWFTLALAAFQAFGISVALEAQPGLVIEPGLMFRFTAAVSLVTGTMFLMWLGEQITERGLGNGISIIIVAGIAAVIVAGGLIYLSQRSGDTSASESSAADVEAGKLKDVKQVTDFFAGVPQNGNTLGDPAAPVTITEFADLRCPVCKTFALETANQMIGTFVKPGKAKYVFRIWPILGPDSVSATQCAIAAQQQNKLFEYQDLWYYNQQDEAIEYATPAYCDGIAKALGLDMTQFQQDRQDEALWTPEVQDVQVTAAQEGFSGTPSFIIEGPNGTKVLTGSLPDIAALTDAIKSVQ
jgi:protein-disulfide isomerase